MKPVSLLFVFGLLLLPSGCGTRDEDTVRVVLVTLDTLRYDTLMGSERRESSMPRTRTFAERGQVFTNFFSATSTTQPTHATLFTGLHPWQTGVPRNGCELVSDHETLAETFQREGYETAAVVASFPLHGKFGFDQGFDEYDDDFTVGLGIAQWEGASLPGENFYSLAQAVTDKALDQLDRITGDRQFFWFHYFDAHSPYGDTGKKVLDLPELLDLARKRNPDLDDRIAEAHELYDRDATYMDAALHELFTRLAEDEQNGITTHIILTADHGESFGEHGSLGHGKRLTRQQIRVPLVILSPAFEPGERNDVAGTVDIPRTLYDLLGIDQPTDYGRDLAVPLPDGEGKAFGMRRTFLEPYHDQRTTGRVVTIKGSRFYTVQDSVLYAGTSALIRENDTAKKTPDPAMAEVVMKLFRAFEGELAQVKVTELEDEATQKALENLGYTQ